jgi:hypothetical protein
MGVGSFLRRQITAIVQTTEVPVELIANPAGILLVTSAAGVPVQVEGTEAEGVTPGTANPIQIAGRTPAPANAVAIPDVNVGTPLQFMYVAHTNGTQLMPTGDAVARAIFFSLTDGVDTLGVAVDDGAVEAEGIQAMGEYAAVQAARDDGDAARLQTTAFGRIEPAPYNRAFGSDQVVEQSPPVYDFLNPEFRASAALPAAGAYDAAPTEVPTGGRTHLRIWISYTRAAAGGSVVVRAENAVTVGGADVWGRDNVINTGAFVAGADTVSQVQRESWEYGSTAAGAEISILTFELNGADLVRLPCAELGAVANPGTVRIVGKFFNG